MSDVLIFGANSAIACALAERYAREGYRTVGVGRASDAPAAYDQYYTCDYTEAALADVVNQLRLGEVKPQVVVSCIGTLHGDELAPEKRLEALSADSLGHYFFVNSIIPALLLKQLSAILSGVDSPKVAFLSAQVGSIGDNHLGGWYGYRASKAALNMLVKTAAIELARRHKGICVLALHPGTTRSPLSAPFTERVPTQRLYSPEVSAERLFTVLCSSGAESNGEFLHWSGERLPW
ncbi:SDR family NAD(P)-dependent oxidoreductase [Gilvimarinus sp. DA14]|uniref:SDR family NAD(P)-dependent oxidoreductase n=1 Tax=Gilvimarinus sp. DA14 TaxID=2956798 RepID=UPI0020B711D9|nr:SDR family NAD(P)-dependent oxidoreductase [Gilvimarinus sp. DA14]UTF61071.1 SDR family NAD(P)-dependent oxidoreductase [Gilvimarinus sp. DA14]